MVVRISPADQKSKKSEIAAPQAVCDVVNAAPPDSHLICDYPGACYSYIPKIIPKNVRLILFRAPLATLASGLRTALV